MNSNDPLEPCRAARQRMSLLIDERLGIAETTDVSVHLEECAACRRFHGEVRTVGSLLGTVGDDRLPDDFPARLRARVTAEASRPVHASAPRAKTSVARHRAAAIAAGILILCGAGFVFGRWTGRRGEDPAGAGETTAPKAPAENVTAAVNADDFLRVAQPFIEDVARLPHVEAEARRPLVQAELAFSALPEKAEKILAAGEQPLHPDHVIEAAKFVTEMASRVADDGAAIGADEAIRAGIILSRVERPDGRTEATVTVQARSSGSPAKKPDRIIVTTNTMSKDVLLLVGQGLPDDVRSQVETFFRDFQERCAKGAGQVHIEMRSGAHGFGGTATSRPKMMGDRP